MPFPKTTIVFFNNSFTAKVAKRFFSGKQKPPACGGVYIRLAMPVIPVRVALSGGTKNRNPSSVD